MIQAVNQIIRLTFDGSGWKRLRAFLAGHERRLDDLHQRLDAIERSDEWERQDYVLAVVEETAVPATIDIGSSCDVNPGLGKCRILVYQGQQTPRDTECWTQMGSSRGLYLFRNFTCEPLLEERVIRLERDYISKERIGFPANPTTIEKFEIDATILAGNSDTGKMRNTCLPVEDYARYTDNSIVELELHNPCGDIVVPPAETLFVWASPNSCCQWIIHLVCCE